MSDVIFEQYSMLSYEEKIKLFEVSKSLDINSNDCILEYGVFFGGSIEPLYFGLLANKKYNSNKIIGVDSFYASKKGNFFDLVISRAKEAKVTKELEITNDYVDWFNYVKNSLHKYKNVNLKRDTPSNFNLNSDCKIALLHLDMPKFHKELNEIMNNIINNLKFNTLIVFQDYFYHWSSEIIAFGYYLIKINKVTYSYHEHSTLAVFNNGINVEDIKLFDLKINNKKFILNLLKDCVNYFKDKINNHQLAILYMSICQYSHINGFKKDFFIYSELINKIYFQYEYTRNYIDWMNKDMIANNYDLYNNYADSFFGFK